MKPSDVDNDDDEFDRQFYLADDDEYIPNSDTGTNASSSWGDTTHGRFIFESERTRAREAEMQKRREAGGHHGQQGSMRQHQSNTAGQVTTNTTSSSLSSSYSSRNDISNATPRNNSYTQQQSVRIPVA